MAIANLDRLYNLMPFIYRQRDEEQGFPLLALLQVITEQANVVENDISQLYDNWFVETCQDWVVPYIGDLIGYKQVHEAGDPGPTTTLEGRKLDKILISRREVANTIRYRRRKGTLSLLENLAYDVAGWPAKAVAFYQTVAITQSLNHLKPGQGRTADLRHNHALSLLNGTFNNFSHTADLRRPGSAHTPGVFNIGNVGLCVWRLRSYPVTHTPAYCLEEVGAQCYTFSVLGNQTPLFNRPPAASAPDSPEAVNVPGPITRREFEANKADYYGEAKSFFIWTGTPRKPVPLENIVPADLTDWQYRPKRNQVAVDPELGRIVFPTSQLPKKGVWVAYYYGFPADIGGGEYQRQLSQPPDAKIYRVGERETIKRLNEAIAAWEADAPRHAVIEITASGVFTGQLNLDLADGQSLQIRAANGARPIIRLLDFQTDEPDSLSVTGGKGGGCLVLDGLLITGRGMSYEGELSSVTVRHCTLVPGWGLAHNCEPRRANEPSIEIFNSKARLLIEHSIVGSIQVLEDEVKSEPIEISISDSVLDATSHSRAALSAPNEQIANVVLSVRRSTVLGQIHTHAIESATNSIFAGHLRVARRQQGAMRFCYVSPGSRTPRRYECQPPLATSDNPHPHLPLEFSSRRYGHPTYCQLALGCPNAIKTGADDEAEMGVYHDLFQPQREANLRSRLNEYTLAGMDAGIIFVN